MLLRIRSHPHVRYDGSGRGALSVGRWYPLKQRRRRIPTTNRESRVFAPRLPPPHNRNFIIYVTKDIRKRELVNFIGNVSRCLALISARCVRRFFYFYPSPPFTWESRKLNFNSIGPPIALCPPVSRCAVGG